jgi:4-amino-4-deoxy-L-arabinose transferase-like glycosyltransferase
MSSIRSSGTATLAAGRQLLWRYKPEAACAILLLLMGLNFLTVIQRKSLTNDELYNIPAGYYNLAARDFGINNVHPPLIRMMAAAPLLPLHLNLPPRQPSENAIAGGHETFTVFWFANLEHMDQIAFWSRAPMIGLTLLLGVTIFAFARRLFGPRVAVLAVLLFTLEPTVLAHGRLVQTDVPAALAYLFFCFMLYRWSRTPTSCNALIAGIACGLALLTKSSLIVTLPIFAAVVLILLWRAPNEKGKRARLLAQVAIATAAMIFIINAAYFFQRLPFEESDARWIAAESPARFHAIMTGLGVFSKIVPAYFLFVFYVVSVINHQGWPASLLGMYSRTGWWYYFPVAFALKTTVPFLLVSTASLAWFSWELIAKKKTEFLWLIGPAAIYAALAMSSNINIGVRHFLPVFPFLLILGGAFLDRLLSQRKLGLAVVALLLCWMSVETVRAYPNYMSYMNQLAWQHPHWYYLSDSNVEWGDDVGELARYLRARGETRVSAAVLGGWLTLRRYGVEYIDAVQPSNTTLPETRYIAIGASYLNGSTVPEGLKTKDGVPLTEQERHDFFAAYRERKPEAVFGDSIYLYQKE